MVEFKNNNVRGTKNHLYLKIKDWRKQTIPRFFGMYGVNL